MKVVLLLILISGCFADTGSSLQIADVSKLALEVQNLKQMMNQEVQNLKSEVQNLKQNVNQEVQLRLEFEQNFLMHIRQLRETKETFITTLDNLVNQASTNVTTTVKVAENKVRGLESEVRNKLLATDRWMNEVSRNLSTSLQSLENKVANLQSDFSSIRLKVNQVGNVAFSARLGTDLNSTKKYEKVVFETVVTNIGSAYSPSTGQFTAPSDGVYIFAWTVLTKAGKSFESTLVVDGQRKLFNAASSGTNGKSYESSGCTGVLRLRKGQKVWIRKFKNYGTMLRANWSSFSGWQIK